MFPADYTDYFNVCHCERNEVQRGNLSHFLADYADYADFFSVMLSEVEASLGIAKRSAFALKSLTDFSNIQ